MKEHPILFSGKMVRAILDGRKTQTRRVIKRFTIGGPNDPESSVFDVYDKTASPSWIGAFGLDGKGNFCDRCPYGKPGDRLWVRECFWMPMGYNEKKHKDKILYKATCLPKMDNIKSRWKPSIHMPRWASRILLEVTDVWVKRVNDAGYEDMIAEGIPFTKYPATASFLFQNLWNSINAKRGFGWDKNPWVWVVEFRRIES